MRYTLPISFGAMFLAVSAPAQTPDALPAAPSAVILQDQSNDPHTWPAAAQAQYAVGPAAGSSFTFTAPATFTGPGGLAVEQPQAGQLPLSLDDAIALGLARNVRVRTDLARQKQLRGDLYQVKNALIPALNFTASTATQETDLAALGFKPSSIKIPGFTGTLPTIVKVDVTQAQLGIHQTLFNAPAWEALKAVQDESDVINLDALTSRGDVVLAVATQYLRVLSDQASFANAQALETSAQQLFSNATDEREAGTGTSLDAHRAQVEFLTRQQQRIAAAATIVHDTIQLNRICGLPAGQQLQLTDVSPLAELADMDASRALATAFNRRKDYLSLQAQLRVADRERLAVKYQRLPTLAFGGFYGVVGETQGLYHGVFAARGTLQFPIFREAAQRGSEEVIAAQLTALHQREADLRVTMDAQIRTALLDVNSAHELVRVAQSNVQLAQQTLSDEHDRFAAGVDDNLPVVNAQASLSGAYAQLVQALFQYNTAKLQLARATGIIETQYRTYLGTAHN